MHAIHDLPTPCSKYNTGTKPPPCSKLLWTPHQPAKDQLPSLTSHLPLPSSSTSPPLLCSGNSSHRQDHFPTSSLFPPGPSSRMGQKPNLWSNPVQMLPPQATKATLPVMLPLQLSPGQGTVSAVGQGLFCGGQRPWPSVRSRHTQVLNKASR